MQKKNNVVDIAQIICFCLITFNMEWALWSFVPMNSAIFAMSCVGVFALNFFVIVKNYKSNILKMVIFEYVFFVIWSVIMIVIYGYFYHIYQNVTFLIFTMDGHAIFFIRLFVSVIPCMFFVDFCDFKETKLFKILFGLIIASNTFFTIRAVRIYPDALRARETMEVWGEEELLFGTPDYAMVYGMALIFPVLLQKCKNAPARSMTKWFYIICTVMVAYMIVVSQFATALLLTIVSTILFMLLNMKPNTRIIVLVAVAVIIFSIRVPKLDVMLLNALSETVSGTWAGKLHDLAETFSGGVATGSVLGRTDLYTKSLQAFIESPVFGKLLKSTTDIGGHATAIDVLGLAGIIGFIPFILTVCFNYKRLKSTCNHKKNKAAIIACITDFILLVFLKNIITSLSVFFAFFVMVPFLLKIDDEEFVIR